MSQTAPDSVLSHWSTLIENLQTSPLTFYSAVESALTRRQIPATQNSRVDYKEAGLMSAQREYLRVKRETLVFDICAAPFGTGFFFSWWFAEETPSLNPLLKVLSLVALLVASGLAINWLGFILGLVLLAVALVFALWISSEMASQGTWNDSVVRALPLIGRLYEWLFKPGTYYRIDSMQMFQQAVHNAVLEVIDQMTTEKGVRALSESDRKPTMHKFYERKDR